MTNHGGRFGGSWTKAKLDVLEGYLDAYTTALKNQPFRLWYIDAFAGSGSVQLRKPDDGADAFLDGSVRRALEASNPPFDRLVFIEKDRNRCAALDSLRTEYVGRDIRVQNDEANAYLQGLKPPGNVRGVLFLDPFATQVSMKTLRHIATLNCFDTWILFPVSAVARMLPKSRQPDDVSSSWARRLNHVYGDDSWRSLYRPAAQRNLWQLAETTREPGLAELAAIYRERLSEAFGPRLLEGSAELRNSRDSVLFELIFCVGNPAGIGTAKTIAAYLLNKI